MSAFMQTWDDVWCIVCFCIVQMNTAKKVVFIVSYGSVSAQNGCSTYSVARCHQVPENGFCVNSLLVVLDFLIPIYNLRHCGLQTSFSAFCRLFNFLFLFDYLQLMFLMTDSYTMSKVI